MIVLVCRSNVAKIKEISKFSVFISFELTPPPMCVTFLLFQITYTLIRTDTHSGYCTIT